MKRRDFLGGTLVGASACVVPACRKAISDKEVLHALVMECAVPNTVAVAEESQKLELAMGAFLASPQAPTLRAVREQWRAALLAWKRAYAFRNGPMVETDALLRAMFWPQRSAAIDALLAQGGRIDAISIETLGVDRKGLFALEHLLFGVADEDQASGSFQGTAGDRRRSLAAGLTQSVRAYADKAAERLGDGRAFAAAFAEGGKRSLNRLVEQMIETVEGVAESRLARVSGFAKSGLLKPVEVEGWFSGTSQQIALACLVATERLYAGEQLGVAQLVRAISAPADQALREAFRCAVAGVRGLDAPLEQVAKRDIARLDAAAETAKTLERSLKTQLASALGVSITFSTGDGD